MDISASELARVMGVDDAERALVRGDESFKYADKARFAELFLKGGLAKPAAALTNSTGWDGVGPISTKTTCRRCFAPGSRLRLRRTTSTKLCGEQSSYSATKRLTTRASYASIPTTRATTSGFSRTRSNTFLRGRSLSNRPGTTHPELPAEACGEDLKACSRCKSVRYCCEAHQKRAWPTHRIVCFAPQW